MLVMKMLFVNVDKQFENGKVIFPLNGHPIL